MNKKMARWFLIVGGIFVVAALVLAAVFLIRGGGIAAPTPKATFSLKTTLTPPDSLESLAAQFPDLADLLRDQELDSVYKDFLMAFQEHGLEAAVTLARERGLLNEQNEVRATLILDTADNASLVAQLEALGVIVEYAYETQVDIAIPLELIELEMASDEPGTILGKLTELEHVIHVRLPRKTQIGRGERLRPFFVQGQGVHAIGADAWHKAGITGKTKVGILDCGFGGYKSLLGTELPDSVTAKTFVRGLSDPNDSEEVHGTAVAEIVHEVAPGAELFFADYGCWSTAEGQAVDWLLEQGVQIISHSAGNSIAPMDGTGFAPRLVQKAANQGVLWVNAMGNEADTHYRGTYVDDDGDGYHEYKPGEEVLGFETYDSAVEVTLRWDDWDQVDQDFDLLLLDSEGNELAWARDSQTGSSGDMPAEFLSYYALDAGEVYYLAILADSATRAVTFDLTVHGDVVIEFMVPEYSLVSPADAVESLSVGAVHWDTDEVTEYSSRGPTTDERLKPEISAPSHVSSAVYGSFSGTSASAPHVSGAAALVWEAHPDWDRQQIWAYLISQAKDLGPAGADIEYGVGRLLLGAPPAAQSPPVPTETLTQSPTETPPLSTPTGTPSSTRVAAATATSTSVPQPAKTAAPTFTPIPAPTVSPPEEEDGGFPRMLAIIITLLVGLCGGLLLLIGGLVILLSRKKRRPQPQSPLPEPPVYQAPQQYQHPPQQRPVRAPPPQYPQPVQAPPPSPQHPRPAQASSAAGSQAPATVCPHCRQPLRPEARFCAHCGQMVVQTPPPVPRCRHCDKELRPGARFCAHCGMKQ